KIIRTIALTFMVALAGVSAHAADLNCNTSNVEQFRYSWRVRGGVRFLAGLLFPTSGVGNLRTVYPQGNGHSVRSELLITAPEGKQGGFYEYGSEIDDRGAKTLATTNGYAWGEKSRREHTIFDYVKGLARIHKETPDDVENRVKKLPEGDSQFRDVLTAIYFLRQNAATINAPVQTSIYTEGREYPVVFRPTERRNFVIDGKNTPTLGFEIVDAPGGRKWPGGVKVWLSNDARRIPVRIEIQQSIASMQLDLKAIESCTQMARLQ
ncbi:MAG TPA: DUF3108 domain-containing protein, partial [Thermoanaerobaculia bacterium]|nr:DUF3108 domain-containing protein [Thermoanaerobaculia bacterium]